MFIVLVFTKRSSTAENKKAQRGHRQTKIKSCGAHQKLSLGLNIDSYAHENCARWFSWHAHIHFPCTLRRSICTDGSGCMFTTVHKQKYCNYTITSAVSLCQKRLMLFILNISGKTCKQSDNVCEVDVASTASGTWWSVVSLTTYVPFFTHSTDCSGNSSGNIAGVTRLCKTAYFVSCVKPIANFSPLCLDHQRQLLRLPSTSRLPSLQNLQTGKVAYFKPSRC